MLCGAAADLFSDPAILAAAKAGFRKRTEKHGYVCPIPPEAVPIAL